MTNSRVRSARSVIVSLVAALAVVLSAVAFAGSAGAAYAPKGALKNFSPVRCKSDTVSVANFPKKKALAVYTTNKGKVVTLKRVKTNKNGAATVKFTVNCSITVGNHTLGVASGKTKVKFKIDVRK